MTREIEELLQKSQRSLQAAKRLLEAKDYDFSISRAYYAMFYSAQTALLSEELEYSSHAAVVARFGEHFIKPDILPRKLGKAFIKAFRLRIMIDYAVSMPSAARESGSGISCYLAQETGVGG